MPGIWVINLLIVVGIFNRVEGKIEIPTNYSKVVTSLRLRQEIFNVSEKGWTICVRCIDIRQLYLVVNKFPILSLFTDVTLNSKFLLNKIATPLELVVLPFK